MKKLALLCLALLTAPLLAQSNSTFGKITTGTSTCTPTNCVYFQIPPNTPWLVVNTTGTWAGTITVQAITSQTATYQNLNSQPWFLMSTITANQSMSVATAGATFLLVQSPTWSSGTASVTITSSQTGDPLLNPVFLGYITSEGCLLNTGAACSGGSAPFSLPNNAPIVSTYGTGTTGYALPTDSDNFIDPTPSMENGGVLYGSYGIIAHGDSNACGFGLADGALSWAGQIFAQTNNGAQITSTTGYYGLEPYCEPGDALGDSERVLMMDFPQDNGNPATFLGYSTNNYYCCAATPTTAQQASLKSQLAAAAAWDGTSNSTDKFMPVAQVATATSYSIAGQVTSQGINLACVEATNNYIPYQWVALGFNGTSGTNFTTSPMSNLNGTPVQILPTNLSTSQYCFTTTQAVTSSTSDVGTATPTNIFSQATGTWATAQPLFDFGFNPGGSGNQGINYSVGNIIEIPCSVQNAKLNVVAVSTLGIINLTLNVTLGAGGTITAITGIATPGSGIAVTPQIGYISGGGGSGAYFDITAQTSGGATAVTLLSGGSGYTSMSGLATSFTGQLSDTSFTVNTLGAGCSPAIVATSTTCDVGSASSCGSGLAINTAIGPAMYTTSTGGTLTSPPANSTDAIYVPKGGDVLMIYPAGPLFGGSLQLLSDGVALQDSYTGNTSLVQTYATNTGPRNFPTKLVMQLAHFKVATGYHQFTVSCASGALCGAFSIIIPTEHNAGVNTPNVTIAGAIPEQGNVQQACGQTLPQSCVSYFSTMYQNVVSDLASAGIRAKYADNQNIDPTLDFVNNGNGSSPAGTPLVQNRLPNTTNGLHMAASGHTKFANNLLWAAKVIPATSSTLKPTVFDASGACSTSMSCWPKVGNVVPAATYIGPGLLTGASQTGGFGRYSGIATVPSTFMTAIGSGAANAQLAIAPAGDAQWRACRYTLGTGYGTAPNIFGINNWNQALCQFEFQDGTFNIMPPANAVSGTNEPSAAITYWASSYNTAAALSRATQSITWGGSGASSAMQFETDIVPSAQAPGVVSDIVLDKSNNNGYQRLYDGTGAYQQQTSISNFSATRKQYFTDFTGDFAMFTHGASFTNNDCPKWIVSGSVATLGDSGAQCGGGSNVNVNGGSSLPTAALTNSTGAGEIDFTNPSGSTVNAALHNTSTTVNGQTCTLGSTCTISASAGTITPGTTTIASGTSNGLLYDNAGVLGNLATANSGVVVTSSGGVPSVSTTLPTGLAMQTPASINLSNGTAMPLSGLATETANTVVGNFTGSTASPTANAMTSCSTASSAVNYTSGTGFGCNTSITANTATSSTNLAGGAVGSAPYQSGAGTTAFLSSPTTSGHTFVYAWQPSGSAIDPAVFDITAYLTSGTMTSYNVTVPSWLTATSCSVTTSGTCAITGTSETANYFLAAPNGSAGAMTPRLIVTADIPTLNQNTTGTAANVTATSNSTLTTLSSLSLPYSQLTGTPTVVADTTITVGSSVAFSANTCSSATGTANTATTVSMTNLATTMTLQFTPNSDVKGVTGWSPGTAGQLYFQAWPSSSGTASYYVCNPTSATITTSASVTWNVSAK